MKCTPGLRNSLGAGANIRKKRSKFMSWYYNIPHSQNREQAHLLTQNKTQQLAGRDKKRLTFQDVVHPMPRASSALPIPDKKGTKEQYCDHNRLTGCCVSALQAEGQFREGTSGHKHQAPTSSGRPAKAKNSFPLPWQEGSSHKSLSCL